MALSCARFLAARQTAGCLYRSAYLAQSRFVTLKASAVVAENANESYDERNARLNRPQSPHLTIYKPQLTSMMSISHRITGMALSSYVMALGIGSLALPETIPHYLQQIEDLHMGGWVFAMKFVLAFPLSYHYINGIRHLIWDSGNCLTIKQVYLTGYLTLAVAAAVTAGIASL